MPRLTMLGVHAAHAPARLAALLDLLLRPPGVVALALGRVRQHRHRRAHLRAAAASVTGGSGGSLALHTTKCSKCIVHWIEIAATLSMVLGILLLHRLETAAKVSPMLSILLSQQYRCKKNEDVTVHLQNQRERTHLLELALGLVALLPGHLVWVVLERRALVRLAVDVALLFSFRSDINSGITQKKTYTSASKNQGCKEKRVQAKSKVLVDVLRWQVLMSQRGRRGPGAKLIDAHFMISSPHTRPSLYVTVQQIALPPTR